MNPTISCSQFVAPTLEARDVYVFGSRPDGLHGQADAGWAFKGSPEADWHSNATYRTAVTRGNGKGLRAVWRQCRGFQEGTDGLGYAIPCAFDWVFGDPATSGLDRSAYQHALERDLADLFLVVANRPDLRFVMGPVALSPAHGGLGLLTPTEWLKVWTRLPGARRENLVWGDPLAAAA